MKPSPGVPKNVPALVSAAMSEASIAHHGNLTATEREIGKAFFLAAHVQADGNDDDEVDEAELRYRWPVVASMMGVT